MKLIKMSKALQKTLINFWGRLLMFLFPSYLLQVFMYSKFDIVVDLSLLQFSYLVNGLLAASIFSTLIIIKNKYNNILGFLYMLGSFIKFGAFFLLFYPEFKLDGDVTKIEFSLFFVPYVISLLIETIDLIKVLNHTEDK